MPDVIVVGSGPAGMMLAGELALAGTEVIERTSMNAWDDEGFVAAVERIGRKKLVLAALGTEACLTFPALCALEEGYEIYVVTDASGGTTPEAHGIAVQRMIQA